MQGINYVQEGYANALINVTSVEGMLSLIFPTQ